MRTTSNRVRRLLAGLLICAGAALGTVVAATPASAVAGLEYVFSPSLSGTQTTLTQSAKCPAGKVVLGGGGYTSDSGRFHLTWTRPLHAFSGDSFVVTAESVGHVAPGFSWTVRAWAVCGNPLSGLEYVSHTETSTGASPLDTHVSCTAGKKLLGLGGRVYSSTGRVVMDDVVPYTDLTGAYVRGYEVQGGDPASWTATVYGVCAPSTGQTLISGSSAYDSATAKTGVVQCPAGKRLHGSGGDIYNGTGQVMMVNLDLYPHIAGDTASLRAHEDQTGYTGSWYARVWAICST